MTKFDSSKQYKRKLSSTEDDSLNNSSNDSTPQLARTLPPPLNRAPSSRSRVLPPLVHTLPPPPPYEAIATSPPLRASSHPSNSLISSRLGVDQNLSHTGPATASTTTATVTASTNTNTTTSISQDHALVPGVKRPHIDHSHSGLNTKNPPSGRRTNADLVSAAEALTQLTKSLTPPPMSQPFQQPSSRSLHSSVASPISSLSIDDTQSMVPVSSADQFQNQHQQQHPLVSKVTRVSKHPIVTNAVTYYEEQKRKYAPFNYAAGIVEKAAIPVVNKIELNLNNRYQAKQLKLEQKSRNKTKKRRKLSKKNSSSSLNSQNSKKNVSLETKKRLQFCLHILKLANDNINNKVVFLQQRIMDMEEKKRIKDSQHQQRGEKVNVKVEPQQPDVSTDTLIDDSETTNNKQKNNDQQPSIPNEAAQQTKTEIIVTVKKIIHLISNFKPSSLNASQQAEASNTTTTRSDDNSRVDHKNHSDNHENKENPISNDNDDTGSIHSENNLELKSTIRDIILRLPATIQQTAITNSTSASQANDRIFVFAKESLDMISKLTNVFNDQLEKAEHWVAGAEEQEQQLRRQLEQQHSQLSQYKQSSQHGQSQSMSTLASASASVSPQLSPPPPATASHSSSQEREFQQKAQPKLGGGLILQDEYQSPSLSPTDSVPETESSAKATHITSVKDEKARLSNDNDRSVGLSN